MLTQLQIMNSFASRLSSVKSTEDEGPNLSSLAPLLSHSLASSTSTLTTPQLCAVGPSSDNNGLDLKSPYSKLRTSHLMSKPISFEKNVSGAPNVLLENAASTFETITQERVQRFVRNSSRWLTTNVSPTGRPARRLAELDVLSSANLFRTSAVVTRFRTLPLSKGRVEKASILGSHGGRAELPLIFYVEIQVTVAKRRKVKLTASTPGKICGTFHPDKPNRLNAVELVLDTATLLQSMQDRASELVTLADKLVSESPLPSRSRERSSPVVERKPSSVYSAVSRAATIKVKNPSVQSARCA